MSRQLKYACAKISLEGIILKPKSLVRTALFAALLCIFCPLAIPAGPIPVTLAIFVVLLTAYILPQRPAVAAVLLYLLMGCVGLPVFSGGQAGFGVLLGPTGGYLWCYVPMVLIAGAGRGRGSGLELLSGTAALTVCYFCGTLQYTLVAGVDFAAGFAACVLPFLVFDIAKILAAWLLGKKIRSRLRAAGLLD